MFNRKIIDTYTNPMDPSLVINMTKKHFRYLKTEESSPMYTYIYIYIYMDTAYVRESPPLKQPKIRADSYLQIGYLNPLVRVFSNIGT